MKIRNYFFFSFIRTVFAILIIILTIYLTVTYFENLLYYFKHHPASSYTILMYYFWQIPDLVVQILPFAVLISGVVLYWSYARSGEITALRSAGMSLLSISVPFICGALFYGAVQFGISEFIRPNAFKNYSYIKYEIIENTPARNLFVKTTWIKSTKGILHFDEYVDHLKVLKNPEYFVYNEDHTSLDAIVRSSSAVFDEKKHIWIIQNATIQNLSSSQKNYQISAKNFETDIQFSPPKILSENVNSNELNYKDLKNFIEHASKANMSVPDRVFDLYSKFSLPFSSFIFLLFTVPFAVQSERKESSYLSILLCFSLTVGYWFGNLALKKLAIYGVLSPFLAAWSLNILFAFIALIMIAKLDKPA